MPGKATEAFLGVKNGCAHAVFHRDVSAEVDESGKPLRVVFSGSAEGAEVVKREFAVVVLGFVGQTLPIQINIGERAREFAFGDEIFKGTEEAAVTAAVPSCLGKRGCLL